MLDFSALALVPIDDVAVKARTVELHVFSSCRLELVHVSPAEPRYRISHIVILEVIELDSHLRIEDH